MGLEIAEFFAVDFVFFWYLIAFFPGMNFAVFKLLILSRCISASLSINLSSRLALSPSWCGAEIFQSKMESYLPLTKQISEKHFLQRQYDFNL